MTALDIIAEAAVVAGTHLDTEYARAYLRWQQAHAESRRLDQEAREAYAAHRRALTAWAAAYTRELEAEGEWRRLRAISS